MFLPQDPTRPYPNTFDESFSDAALLDVLPPDQPVPESSIDRDNKLLSFHPPTYNFTLLDYSLRRTCLSLKAQLHGMFFMAESPSTVADTNVTPAELTCYRRNLFQITGSITLPRTLRYILTDQGDRIPILAQELSISATESVEGHPVKLISVPWKTPASNALGSPEDKTEKEPSSIPLDTMSNQDMDADYATFPIAWKRLQFRIATANNGRRKELQQHFVVRLRVVATLSTGAKVSICEAKSGAIIVRGRSPRNFQQRKDFPVGGTGSSSRKGMPPPVSRHSSESAPQKSPRPTETSPGQAFTSFNFDQPDGHSPSPHFSSSDWNPSSSSSSTHVATHTHAHAHAHAHANANANANATATANSAGSRSSYSRPGSGSKSKSKSKSQSQSQSPPAASVPLPSHDETEANRQRSRTHKAARISNAAPVSRPPYKHPSLSSTAAFLNTHSASSLSDGLDSADLLYEYFPLGLDDWMPPVDAVYRPHVVHHMNIAQTATAGGRAGLTGRSKRYFSEDQS